MRLINPSMKFIGLLVPAIIIAFTQRPYMNLVIFGICIILMLLSRVNLKALAVCMVPVFLCAASFFTTGYYFNGLDEHIGSIMGSSAVMNGLTMSGRVLVFAGLGLLLVLTTDKMEMIRSMRQQLKMPEMFAYALLATWGVLPGMLQEYKKTKLAFRARGIRTMGISPALLRPLLVKSVRWSEALAAAMESKGFTPGSGRTEYYVIKLKAADIIFPILTIGGLVLYLCLT